MNTSSLSQAHKMLFLNTFAFCVFFACWTINGVLLTHLADSAVFDFSIIQIGWLMGIPIFTGSVFRLPIGVLTDKYGGKPVTIGLLFVCAGAFFLLPFAESFGSFALISALFGLAGSSFAVGIPYTSVWYPQHWQGRALGIFGSGNAGAAVTTFVAPSLLEYFSRTQPETGWKTVVQIYGIALVVVAFVFIFFAKNKISPTARPITQDADHKSGIRAFLTDKRVLRFSLYYFLVFGAFVAYSQWLVPYFVNVYQETLILAGLFTSFFSLPSGVIRALGGWLSDLFGARKVMYWVLYSSVVISGLLMIPRMSVLTQYTGVMAQKSGQVKSVSQTQIQAAGVTYNILPNPSAQQTDLKPSVLPRRTSWQEVVVQENDVIKKKELLARGITRIDFEANIWVYVVLVSLIGAIWGIGKAAVYKYIPQYFPGNVGVVGGIVGFFGGLGGFAGPILFGYLLNYTGIWTSSWIFIFLLSMWSLLLLQHVTSKIAARSDQHTM